MQAVPRRLAGGFPPTTLSTVNDPLPGTSATTLQKIVVTDGHTLAIASKATGEDAKAFYEMAKAKKLTE